MVELCEAQVGLERERERETVEMGGTMKAN